MAFTAQGSTVLTEDASPRPSIWVERFSIVRRLHDTMRADDQLHADDLFEEEPSTSYGDGFFFDDSPLTPPDSPTLLPTFLEQEPSVSGDHLTLLPTFLEPEPTASTVNPAASSSGVHQQATSSKAKRRFKSKQRGKENKKKKAKTSADAQQDEYLPPEPRTRANQKYAAQAVPVFTSARAADARVTRTGYTASRSRTFQEVDPSKESNDTKKEKRVYTLQELIGDGSSLGFKLINWDGNTPMPIVDVDNLMLGVLVGKPDEKPDAKGPKWMELCQEGAQALHNARLALQPPDSSKPIPRRGDFNTLRTGVSHGGGQTQPTNFKNTGRRRKEVETLNGNRFFRSAAGFISASFAHWAPKLENYYRTQIGKLFVHDRKGPCTLKAPFKSVFTATTYNLGPQTACLPHIDSANLAFGWCGITALGNFDPDKGGHLVLWECRLVIRFPPGSTILLASALLHHSNVPLAEPHETRYSFTQYTAGALFRWVEHEFQTKQHYRDTLTAEQLAKLDGKDAQRWSFGLSLMPRRTPPKMNTDAA